MSAPYMYLLGQGSSTNRVYMARKPWGQIGSMPISRSKIDPGASVGRRTKSLEPD
jgi:hypothetical protein